jgi:hypothetical protein
MIGQVELKSLERVGFQRIGLRMTPFWRLNLSLIKSVAYNGEGVGLKRVEFFSRVVRSGSRFRPLRLSLFVIYIDHIGDKIQSNPKNMSNPFISKFESN